jgi:hypothetical protein
VRYHIRVTPIPDEPLILDRRQALDGLGWLNGHLADGSLIAAEAFPETGGYMIAEAANLEALTGLLASYPLLHTIRMDINELVTLEEGFAVLLAAIDKRERIRS